MRTQESSPWIVRCSVRLYRWLLCLGPHSYRRQYADRTLQLFRECCEDAYRQRGTRGVLSLWPSLLSDVVAQMLAEQFSELQRAAWLDVSVETVSSSVSERRSSMNSKWQRFNHTVVIPMFGSLTRFRRKLMRPLVSRVERVRFELELEDEKRSWLNQPTNMHFKQGLRHWVTVAPSGVVTSDLQGRSSAFLLVTKVPNIGMMTMRQTIKADDYRGKQLRFSGEVKAEQVEQEGGLYIRTNVIYGKHIQHDSRVMQESVELTWGEEFGVEQPGDPSIQANRPDEKVRPQHLVQGTHDWMRCEATVPVAEDALFIRFGLILYGKGQIWLANARLEVIEQDGKLPASV